MIAAQRAWVGPFDAQLDGKFTPVLTPEGQPTSEVNLTKGVDVDVVIKYANTGREPALAFTTRPVC
jgi:hypothetical protein